ncbi:MAG: chromosomal replication initiator protein DnaA [Roseitalea sp.]|nr:chromosomal replication initiator protein DnaA [Roseitalea sp.]MBO6952464.1 chromosomal replication initiator protein DnaA [Rhizobiaceae bacterium]RNC91533.1 MAG: chromosomal replication initiator protein DnaA [Oricola sp.]MBO6593050.1 chromosomal replication initiator protein DnaA [Roseitalea sp.]MBO6600208.1 chromosomal replication initiator protein DnaA [Roseitalea sp.]
MRGEASRVAQSTTQPAPLFHTSERDPFPDRQPGQQPVAQSRKGSEIVSKKKSEEGGRAGQPTGDGRTTFDKVCQQLRAKLGGEVYQSWFKRLKLEDASGPVIQLSVPTPFLRNWINNHYLDTILDFWREADGNALKIDVVVRSATRGAAVSERAGQVADAARASAERAKANAMAKSDRTPAAAAARQGVAETGRNGEMLGSPVDSRYTFDSFVEGPSNRVCLAAARAAVEQGPNAARFNPLFFHSNVGLGKTHLLQAIANAAKAKDPTKRVVYLTAEYFMWRFASAIRDQSALRLKETLHEIDLLVIDDMQFLQGEKIQSEFCHLINTLLDSARQVVVAGDRPPSELESLDPRVRSRLHGGVALEIQAPDYDMRLSMLQRRLEEARRDDTSLDISEQVLAHVAQTVCSSFRELEGAFNQLVFRHSFEPDIALDRVDDILGHLVRIDDDKKIRIEDIQKTVANHYNVARGEMLSNRRTRSVVRPRQIAMYLSKTMTPRSLPEIGRRFGGKDHTTVLHAVRKVESLIKDDPKLAKEIELLRRLIKE